MTDTQVEFPGEPGRPLRKLRYTLRRVAGRLLPQERVASCGSKVVASTVQLHRGAHGGAHWSGLEHCGSVWHCPVCAAKIAEGRKEEVEQALGAHVAAGGAVYLVALTVRHHRFQSVAELRQGVSQAWRKMGQGRAWQLLKAVSGIVGTIRALEVTHGANGWHPHLHVILATRRPLDEREEAALAAQLFDRWSNVVARVGLGQCERAAFDFQRAHNVGAAGEYVAKWGTAAEVAKGSSKLAKGSGRAPWQLLIDAGQGDRTAAALFMQYAAAFKGARQLTWSTGFRELYGIAEKEDDELVADPLTTATVAIMPPATYQLILRENLTAACLDAVERGGWAALAALLHAHNIRGARPGPHPSGDSRVSEGESNARDEAA